jgi:hypothetical protein
MTSFRSSEWNKTDQGEIVPTVQTEHQAGTLGNSLFPKEDTTSAGTSRARIAHDDYSGLMPAAVAILRYFSISVF